MRVTYRNSEGEFVTEEFTKEKGDKSRSEYLNKAYEEGNMFFCMLDLSGKKGITNKVNANPKFRDNETT